ncbi:hypothetical protein ACEZCY_35640 [Streptacidiphilus sp. N1-12]|uniref:Uncharacterized protein n=1 Tax=Streptacidiphilus alkalitolerans TaxID=3342712 RepID=A0ABV6WR53_9ACTN
MNSTIVTVTMPGRADCAAVVADVLRLAFGSVVQRAADQDHVHTYDVDTASHGTQTVATVLDDPDARMDVEVTGPAFTQDITVREFQEIPAVERSPAQKVVDALDGSFEEVVFDLHDDPPPAGQERYRVRVSVGRMKG